ncbi:MAG: hypothetical protein HY865_24855 [Chloroflexi bacterium]|nr:hypothetical protein [Chloroflexota bacterium]
MDILPVLKKGRLVVLYAPGAAVRESMGLIAELALRGPLTIFDGGNRYQPYLVANLLRRKTVEIETVANRLFSRRAFTCYELHSLLASAQGLPYPLVILDLLNTFYDDHVPDREVRRLLSSCLEEIERLVISAPVIITLAPPLVADRVFLLEQVCAKANEIFVQEVPAIQPLQPALF